jgi:hypothetical protein
VFAVDYTSVEHLTTTLEKNNVHTVISTITMIDATAGQAEVNMVAAAAKSFSTKRFIASNWGVITPDGE